MTGAAEPDAAVIPGSAPRSAPDGDRARATGDRAPADRGTRTRVLRPGRRAVRRTVRVVGTLATVAVAALALALGTGMLAVQHVTSSSMVPALAVGDIVVTRTATAADARVGDIVTLTRPDGRQVTHRVLATAPDPARAGDPDARLITLRGDANSTDDPAPYPVTEVGLVVVRVPLVGGVLGGLAQSPRREIVLGALALVVVAALVPGRRRRRH
ncbi:MAG TPA: signal peptidase I [Cellulomonas sp.]